MAPESRTRRREPLKGGRLRPVTYRAELSPRTRRQLAGIPMEARFALAEALSIVVDAPYAPTFTEPTPHPDLRQTIFGRWVSSST